MSRHRKRTQKPLGSGVLWIALSVMASRSSMEGIWTVPHFLQQTFLGRELGGEWADMMMQEGTGAGCSSPL